MPENEPPSTGDDAPEGLESHQRAFGIEMPKHQAGGPPIVAEDIRKFIQGELKTPESARVKLLVMTYHDWSVGFAEILREDRDDSSRGRFERSVKTDLN
jgi:hypothetical protein